MGLNKLILMAALYSIAGAAMAQNVSYGIQGSSFIVQASNNTNQAKNCHISYTLNYTQFGDPGSQSFNSAFGIPANWSGVVVNHQTTYAASSLRVSDVQWSCS